MYFVGDNSTKNTLISKGVEQEKIIIRGIPVRQCFKNQKKEDIGIESKNLLIMGGGLGLLPNCDNLLEEISYDKNIKVTLIAGKNEKLRLRLQNKFPSINVIGFTQSVCEYMRNADLIITKAGGITTYEAIETETPLYIIKPFLEQEYGNAKYIEQHNIGRIFWSGGGSIPDDLQTLLNDKKLIDTMKENMRKIKTGYEKIEIAELLYGEENRKCS